MPIWFFAVFFLLFHFGGANSTENVFADIKTDLATMNSELGKMNAITAFFAWRMSTETDSEVIIKSLRFGEVRTGWRNNWCAKLTRKFRKMKDLDYSSGSFPPEAVFDKNYNSEFRQFYLLCRGPKYTLHQARELTNVLGQLQNVYQTTEVCLSPTSCLRGEPDLERVMTQSRDPDVLLWAWTEWRNAVGPPSKIFYPSMVTLLNEGAQNNGYNDIGECWREELEVPNLEKFVDDIYSQVETLYKALHAVVRYKLHDYYGPKTVPLRGPIPAHLLGNMWAQNWQSLLDIVIGENTLDLTERLRAKNYTVLDLVKKAEDFYVSLGFRPMTHDFWKHSRFRNAGASCHGTAANMFKRDDFRILLCAQVTDDDFYVIHHEMGHVEYYMAYQDQPSIFQDGANSAFQEAIGDSVMYGVLSPTHLHRLGLLRDSDDLPGFDIKYLLRQALNKIPQISFALALEKWRWGVFRGDISPDNYNSIWWRLRHKYQGLKPPTPRNEKHFDPSSKFHINDNTPYIRYFLSSILQVQIFESLCKSALYGTASGNVNLPFPLHRCDIYGSKQASSMLRRMMSFGSKIPWKESLRMVTGETNYSVRPLLEYYKPLQEWLEAEISRNNIPVGWDYID